MFTVVVNIDGLERRFDTLADAAGDLDKPLAAFGGYLKKKAIDIVKRQDFPPLAKSTIEKRAQKGLRSLERKLQGDQRKAFKRARLARGPQNVGVVARVLTSSAVRRAAEDAMSSQTRGVQNRTAVLAEFQKRHRRPGDRAVGAPLSIKQLASLGAREDRAQARAVGAPILGGFARTYAVKVSGGTVTVTSASHGHFTEALNKGGTVGHGAVLPKRDTLPDPSSEDMNVFESILVEHHLLPAFNGAR